MAATSPSPEPDVRTDVLEPDLPGLPWPALVTAIPDLGLSAVYLAIWLAPGSVAPGLPRDLVLLMLLEFIIIHSSALMGVTWFAPGDRRKKSLAVLGLGFFYTLFVGSFALGFHTAWPLVTFWGLTLNRLLGVIVGQAPIGGEEMLIRRGWAATALFYIGAVFLTTLAPIPRLGVSADAVARMHLPSSGLWIEQPWRVMALGFLYFGAVGVSELFGHRWIRTGDIPER